MSRLPIVVRLQRSFARFGGLGVLDQLLLAGSGFLVTLVVARTGGPHELGVFVLIQSVYLTLAGLSKALVGDPLVVEMRESAAREPLGSVKLVLLLHGFVALMILFVVLAFETAGLTRLGSEVILMLAFSPLAAFYEFARSVRLAAEGENSLVRGDVVVAAGRVGGLVIGGLFTSGAMLGLLSVLLGSLLSVATVARTLRIPFHAASFKKLVRVGRWFVGESVLFSVSTYGIWVVAVPRAGTGAAGQLRAVQQLFAPVQSVLVGLSTVLLGRLAERQGRLIGNARTLGTGQLASVGVWGALVTIAGPAGVEAIFGRGFSVGRGELAMFSVGVLMSSAYGVAAMQLKANRLGGTLLWARATAALVGLSGVLAFGTSFLAIAIANFFAQVGGYAVARYGLRRRKDASVARDMGHQ